MILNEINVVIKKKKKKFIEKKLKKVKSKHTDVSKCFEAVPLLKATKPKKKLIVYNHRTIIRKGATCSKIPL